MTKLTTAAFSTHIIRQIQESISESANNAYYIYASEHRERSSSALPTPVDKVRTTYIDAYRKMLFGKRIDSSSISLMVANNTWTTGTEYHMYDDNDEDHAFNANFFVVVDETAYLHVYKCLDNNMNADSTAQPTFTHITGSNSTVYQTSDGYRWKYMYSFSSAQDDQFSTQSFIPVVANTTVTAAAIAGTLDVVKIDDGGKNYGNYTSGTFSGSEVRIGGNTLIYEISNSSINQTNGYYTGCLIYIASGTGIGQHKKITDYFVNSTGSYTVVNNEFTTGPTNGSTFEINPSVTINGSGDETTVAVARALINSLSTNSIYRVEMLNRGAGYTYHTANVVANSVVGVTTVSSLRPIYGPPHGHGYDAAVELYANKLCVGVSLANTEANTIPALNTYQKIGIMKDPIFANVVIEYWNGFGTFTDTETVYKINPIRVDRTATINTSSNVVISLSGDFDNQFAVGDYVYLKSNAATEHMVATVNAISNGTYMTLSANGKFACTDTLIYKANVSSNAVLAATTNSTHMVFSTVSGLFQANDMYIGVSSGAQAQVNTVSRNGVTKTFDTFVQMYKYDATMTSGLFTLDEAVFQGVSLATSTANAYIHSANIVTGVATVYTTENLGSFATSDTMEGNTSGSTATLNTKYSPELVFGSGDILSIENVQTITRANNTTESFKLIFEFDPTV
jgi:hypothetical protein